MKNLPNQITISRIVLVFIGLLLANIYYKFPQPYAYAIQIITVIVAVIAGLTDLIDGWVARKYNLVSDFGKLMDPLADKIFVMTIFIMFVDTPNPITKTAMLPGWVVIVVLAREFLVTGLRSIAATKGEVIAADKLGKLKTAVQMAFFVFGGFIWLGIIPLAGTVKMLWIIAMLIVAVVTVYSGLWYFIKYKHLYLSET
ncbi:MAG TPA: CDP-diacylglycerol--glycerol-3-phosphate 3-phosphatidyltransferase [Lentisphaeria bacterium]|nr:MAG: CDP-diacylglycerol--glycerol-3-phosphate 3-phosphatidyltransferase [Lentisphaerae bacterium GWF2_38_69]HBM17574.1 CDP-diacylglycerol--glycerol-3-phosphate 3-phosphatidyltransferase [Lentisphaeria bacterium]